MHLLACNSCHLTLSSRASPPSQDPENVDFKGLYRQWKREQAAAAKKEASLYASMFRRPAGEKQAAPAAAAEPAAAGTGAEA